jgi:hypothetical protein
MALTAHNQRIHQSRRPGRFQVQSHQRRPGDAKRWAVDTECPGDIEGLALVEMLI